MSRYYPQKPLGLFFYLFLAVLLSACSIRKQRTLFNAPTDVVTDTIKQVYVVNDQGIGSEYKIKVNDRLAIRNIQDKEFGAGTTTNTPGEVSQSSNTGSISNITSYLVDVDGRVNLPAIGKVAVAGLSRRDARLKIQELYAKNLLRDPIIELTVVNLKVTVLGEFNKQGNFLLEKDNTTLIDVIGEAGGISKTADPKTLKIIRGDRAKPEIIYVNLTDINSLASKKLTLQDNDIIVLQQTKGQAVSERLSGFNNFVQPLLVVVNLAVLIFTITR